MPDNEAPTSPKTPGTLEVLRRSWSTLLAADLLAKGVGFLLVTPATALLLRFFADRSGSPVLTDADILFFFLSPTGAVALLFIGVLTFWVLFVEHAVMLTVAYAAAQHGTITLLTAYRFVAARSVGILRLSVSLLLRTTVIALPFLAAAAIAYFTLLTRFDINYYLSIRPPVFWGAAGLLGLILTALVTVLAVSLFHWIFALPFLLFQHTSARAAITKSAGLIKGQRLRVAGWLITWAVALLGVSAVATGLIGLAGRLLIPSAGESLTLVALAVGLIVLLSGAANLAVSFVAAALLSLLVVHLYTKLGGSGHVTVPTVPAQAEVGWQRQPQQRKLRQAIIWGSTCVIVSTVTVALLTVASIPTEDTTQITAHRGSSAKAPENTLASVQQAIADGADWVEIDVQEIADGTVIVFHDSDLKRLGREQLRTPESTYAQLSEIDIGIWLSPAFSGQRIPTLEQVLEACRDRIRVNIELKYYGSGGNLEQKVIDIVERYRMESQVVLMSLERSRILNAKALRPDWKMGFLTAVALGDLTKIDVDFLAVNTHLATRSLIWSAHRKGKEVHVWTVNDPVQMWALISRGADNLITDLPELGRSVLIERSGMSVVQRLLVEFGSWSGLIPSTAQVSDESDA